MKKPQVPLAQDLHKIAIPLMQKNLGIKTDLPLKNVDGDIYFGETELKDIEKQLKKKIDDDPQYPKKIHEKIEKSIENLNKVIKELESLDIQKLTDEELIYSFLKGYQAIGEVTAFMSFKGTVQISNILDKQIRSLLRGKISDIEEQNNAFLQLSVPSEDSFMSKEQQSIMKVALGEETLTEHTKKFAWMGIVMYTGRPFTEKHFQKELDEASDCQKQLDTIEEQKKIRDSKIEEVVKKLNLTKEESDAVDELRTWIHLRTYVKDNTSIGMVPTVPLLDEIAKRLDVTYEDLIHLDTKGLKNIFSDKDRLIEESKKRQKAWGWTLIDCKETYYNEENLDEIREKEEDIPDGIKGSVACQGIVKGKAIIVNNIEDLKRIEKGDILITHMTTTNFVPILSKVSAIVTDEGGLTCHAAIVSREMNKPCIIGTKNATKVLKDGDTVEVDADKGIVKKLA